MKTYDFTKPGRRPLVQDVDAFLQSGWQECVLQLQAQGDNGFPVVLSGMAITVVGSVVTVTDGWFMYGGKIIKFTGSSVTLGGGEVALVTITNSLIAAPLAYSDASTPAVMADQSAALTHAATVTDATHFPVLSMVQWVTSKSIVGKGAFTGAATINFRSNQTIIFGAMTTGFCAITLDLLNAVPGASVTIQAQTSSVANALSLPGWSGNLLGQSPASVGTGFNFITLRFTFQGIITGQPYMMLEYFGY